MSSFFACVAAASGEILRQLPAPTEPQPIAYVEGELDRAISSRMSVFVGLVPGPDAEPVRACATSVGLNTVGMLADRLTILCIKEWCLRVKKRDIAAADGLKNGQIHEIVAALDEARPGLSSINNKMTNVQAGATYSSFASAYAGLLTTNLKLWEAQEVLYLRDILELGCDEIRAYVSFFSRGNVQRNALIEGTDRMYWAARGELAARSEAS